MKAITVTKYILLKAKENEKIVSNLKLQKMLYFIDLEYIKKNNKKLIDESFEAWPHGAVIKSIYDQFKIFGANNIRLNDYEISKEDKDILDGLEWCVLEYLKWKPWDLVELSHKPNGAWSKCYEKGKNRVISFKKMHEEAKNE